MKGVVPELIRSGKKNEGGKKEKERRRAGAQAAGFNGSGGKRWERKKKKETRGEEGCGGEERWKNPRRRNLIWIKKILWNLTFFNTAFRMKLHIILVISLWYTLCAYYILSFFFISIIFCPVSSVLIVLLSSANVVGGSHIQEFLLTFCLTEFLFTPK